MKSNEAYASVQLQKTDDHDMHIYEQLTTDNQVKNITMNVAYTCTHYRN